jgi:hypothetical protein
MKQKSSTMGVRKTSAPSKLRGTVIAVAAVVGVVAIGATVFSMRNAPTSTIAPGVIAKPAHSTPVASVDSNVPLPATGIASDPSLQPGERAPFRTPTIEEYERVKAFERRVRAFFDDRSNRGTAERARQAAALRDEIAAAETAGHLTSSEALTLYIALMQESGMSADEARVATASIAEGYRAKAEARDRAMITHPDPRHVEYKREEESIVREVMSMPNTPDGRTRDDMLRERLEEARIRAYRRTLSINQ